MRQPWGKAAMGQGRPGARLPLGEASFWLVACPAKILYCAPVWSGLVCPPLVRYTCTALIFFAPLLPSPVRHLQCFSSTQEDNFQSFVEWSSALSDLCRNKPHLWPLIGPSLCKWGLSILPVWLVQKKHCPDWSESSHSDGLVKMLMWDLAAQLQLDGGSLSPIG